MIKKLSLDEGRWPNGEPVEAGSPFHPQGHGSDIAVYICPITGSYRAYFQYPVYRREKKWWATSIYTCWSADGEVFSPPVPVIRPTWKENGQIQHETPSFSRIAPLGINLLATLTYDKDHSLKRRVDGIQLWSSQDPASGFRPICSPITATEEWEQPFRDPGGWVLGGPQEPGDVQLINGIIVVPYLATSYADGHKPSLALAWTRDGQTWEKKLLVDGRDEKSETGLGQAGVSFDETTNQFHLLYQRKNGRRESVIHATSQDLVNWEGFRERFSNETDPSWNGRISAPHRMIGNDGRERIYFFGHSDSRSQTRDFGLFMEEE